MPVREGEGFPNRSGEALQRSGEAVMKSQRAGEGCPRVIVKPQEGNASSRLRSG